MDILVTTASCLVIIFGIIGNTKRIQYYQVLEKNNTNNQLQRSALGINTSLEIVVLGMGMFLIVLICKIYRII